MEEKIGQDELKDAEFWGEGFCLDCEIRVGAEEADCPECGEGVMKPKIIQRVLELFESAEGEE